MISQSLRGVFGKQSLPCGPRPAHGSGSSHILEQSLLRDKHEANNQEIGGYLGGILKASRGFREEGRAKGRSFTKI